MFTLPDSTHLTSVPMMLNLIKRKSFLFFKQKRKLFFEGKNERRYSCMNSHPTHHSYTQPI